ncbi:MAG TPA: hypothetical protein VK694_07590 [Verrucomicrobiae bacterium]|nr:hypothetical protein [Verrucomicrobiae bacterium]
MSLEEENKNPSNSTEFRPAFTPDEPSPDQMEADPRAEQIALTEQCGTLVENGCAAFNTALAAARQQGLDPTEQEHYIKDLWEKRQIPRIFAASARSYSTLVGVVDADRVQEVRIVGLERHTDEQVAESVDTPMVLIDRSHQREAGQEEPVGKPVKSLGVLGGYFKGGVEPSFMPPVSAGELERLRQVATSLEKASVIAESAE